MALRNSRLQFSANIWPGFVDAMTALLLILFFVLSIFMIVQFSLRETISGQDRQLNDLTVQLSALAQTLGFEKSKNARLEQDLALSRSNFLSAQQQIAQLEARNTVLLDDIAQLRTENTRQSAVQVQLESALEAARKRAEETLTLLAAAELAQKQLKQDLDAALSDTQRAQALLALANQALQQEKALSADGQREIALLNQQTMALRAQLEQLQAVLDESAAKDAQAQLQIENLGKDLNAALARVATEQRKRADAEAKARALLEKQADDLRQFRSEFFGRLRKVFEQQEGVQIVGDRFIFSAEVLFDTGSAVLGEGGKEQIRFVASLIERLGGQIPPNIDWVLQVDGHTDRVPIRHSRFFDNWALSQARALSVVRFLIDDLGFPPERLAANGFGEFQPIDPANTPEAHAANRRIELKFTER